MRLGRKLADGFAADPEAEQVQHAPAPEMTSERTAVRAADAGHTEAERTAPRAERSARV
ncbi:hypothetical protein [Pseudonocardia asaccharolytica]|uniref:Uncharacterized protein n=1 Tax=Pseudonocardia asaccharolytica DSM 44247 = NBRC 16224 TaxID=1123024 RepID=A0A511D2H9_9PSEU|nr:hypothetical protein [Pseudonocardia asaccharolytica]GEL18982.1 hypothetical protein PA7_28190 [Pseudonocardia asaccharolytica DSM 44247 = NBRC 16224]